MRKQTEAIVWPSSGPLSPADLPVRAGSMAESLLWPLQEGSGGRSGDDVDEHWEDTAPSEQMTKTSVP